MCVDQAADMFVRTCADALMDMFAEICIDTCIEGFVDTCIHRCIDMCATAHNVAITNYVAITNMLP